MQRGAAMSNQASIKAMTRNLVGLVGGPKVAAKICDVSETEISYWCNDNHTRFIPIDHLMDLDAAAGNLFVKEWARSVSPDNKTDAAESLMRTLAQFSKHTGELEYTTLDALEDGQLTPGEKRRIRDHVAPVKNIISQLEAVIS